MKKRLFGGALALGVAFFAPGEAYSQSNENEPAAEGAAATATEQPAGGEPPEGEVPPVEVIQPKPEPTPAPVEAEARPEPRPRPRPAPQPVVSAPPPPPPPVADLPPLEPEIVLPSIITQPVPGYYGRRVARLPMNGQWIRPNRPSTLSVASYQAICRTSRARPAE
ncbi:hypothetical protein AUC71_11835 [Methyloceanibacter marginalis]|uniref:Uncharacterized protein n=1 Tax=Methyloceanibacter marginalis TaxID=1774971 RepID=A0A1E3WB72_9HYPH|nr:hypothetical protein AUC71_11835 [Methyloceanibacter marginalis]